MNLLHHEINFANKYEFVNQLFKTKYRLQRLMYKRPIVSLIEKFFRS